MDIKDVRALATYAVLGKASVPEQVDEESVVVLLDTILLLCEHILESGEEDA